jgi:hypothetical protein
MMMASAARPARGGDVLAEWAQSLTSQAAGRALSRRYVVRRRTCDRRWRTEQDDLSAHTLSQAFPPTIK